MQHVKEQDGEESTEMGVVNTVWVNRARTSMGFVDEYVTVVKADVDFECGCGHDINIKARKVKNSKDKYDFTIKHRNRVQKVVSDDPTETQIFDKMLKVSTYAACRFPRGSARRRK